MKHIITLCAVLLIITVATTVHSKSVTFYADGAIVELEASAHKGVAEIPLPASMIDGSLRVKPLGGTSIQRVEIIAHAALDSGRADKELTALLEQKNRLGDRLLALSSRETIFTSAAKVQSGKAPRKSKTNPEPMQSIRQGTEFAIAQLEAVYTARRKTEQDLRRVDSRISALTSSRTTAETRVRIAVSTPQGKVAVHYALGGQGWTPRYDIHLNGSGSAQVNLSGQFPLQFQGYLLLASPSRLADVAAVKPLPVQPGPHAIVARYALTAMEEHFETGAVARFSFELKNHEALQLPAGDASIYHKGEYVGRVKFEGLSSGRTRRVALGR